MAIRWGRAARDRRSRQVYVSARNERDEPDSIDRIVIVERAGDAAAYCLHRPGRRWIVLCCQTFTELGSFLSLRDGLNAVRPVLA